MTTLTKPDYNDLFNDDDKWRFEAHGSTYRHKDKFKSWNWQWNPVLKFWTIPTGQCQPKDPAVLMAKKLEDIWVKATNVTTGEVIQLR